MKAVISILIGFLLSINSHANDTKESADDTFTEISSKESLIEDMYQCDGELTCLKIQTARILERYHKRNQDHGHSLSIRHYSVYARKYLDVTGDPSFVSKAVALLLKESIHSVETLDTFYESVFLSGDEALIKKYLHSMPENLDLNRISERHVERARIKWAIKETKPDERGKAAKIPEKETLFFNNKNLKKYIIDDAFLGACEFYKKYRAEQSYYMDSTNLRFAAKQRESKLLDFFKDKKSLFENSCGNTKDTCERYALSNQISAHLGFNDDSYEDRLKEYSDNGKQEKSCATLLLGSNLHELLKLQDNSLFKQTIAATQDKLGDVYNINDGSVFEEKKSYLDSLARSVLLASEQSDIDSLNILLDKIRSETIALKFADVLSTIISYESDASTFTSNLSYFTNVVNKLDLNNDEKNWLYKKLLAFNEADELKITWMHDLINEDLSIENADVIVYKMETNVAQYTADDLDEAHRLINYTLDSLLIRFLQKTTKFQNEVYALVVEGEYALNPPVKDKLIALEKVIDFFNESREYYDTQPVERTIGALLSFSIKTNDIDTFSRLLKLYSEKIVEEGLAEGKVENIIKYASDVYPLQVFNIINTIPVDIEHPTVAYCRLATNNYTKEATELYNTHPSLLLRYISEQQIRTHCSYELAVRSQNKELFKTLFIDKDYYQILDVLLDVLNKLNVEKG